MGKTLYISDLDGTLLQNDAKLSDYTTQVLQSFTQRGGLFSVATARTWESTTYNHFLDPVLPLSVPIVLMNGALVYDTQTRRYVKKALMEPQVVRDMLVCVKAHGQTGNLYSLKDDFIRVYHEDVSRFPLQLMFNASRKQTFGKNLIQTHNIAECAQKDIVQLSMRGSHESLLPLYESLRQLPGIDCTFYPDSYLKDCWMLECFSRFASKFNAVRYLREAYGFDKIIGFGDNLNDIPLFEACDEAYAVANAREELKAVATGVIGANTEDGVAKFLEEIAC